MGWAEPAAHPVYMHPSIHPHPQTPHLSASRLFPTRNAFPLTRFRITVSARRNNGEDMVRIGCKRWDRDGISFGVLRTRVREATHRLFRLFHRHRRSVHFFTKWSIKSIFNSEMKFVVQVRRLQTFAHFASLRILLSLLSPSRLYVRTRTVGAFCIDTTVQTHHRITQDGQSSRASV